MWEIAVQCMTSNSLILLLFGFEPFEPRVLYWYNIKPYEKLTIIEKLLPFLILLSIENLPMNLLSIKKFP